MKERIIRFVAGLIVLISIVLVWYTKELNWLGLTLFVALNLMQSSISKWCLLDQILVKLGVKSTHS